MASVIAASRHHLLRAQVARCIGDRVEIIGKIDGPVGHDNPLRRQRQKCKRDRINQIGEETLEAINDLSEDTRKELDSIYLALSELADKEKTESLKSKHRRPIGFIHYDNEE